MNSSDFRAEARKRLEGKWGKAAVLTLAYAFVVIVISFIESKLPDEVENFASLAATIIEVPLSYGLIISLFKLYKGEEVKAFDFCTTGFQNFQRSWGISWNIALKMIIPIVIIIVGAIIVAVGGGMAVYSSISSLAYNSTSSGLGGSVVVMIIGVIALIVGYILAFVKSYYYQLAMLVAIENPEMTTKDAVLKSQEIMTGNRAKLFVLQLTFIGWAILAAISLGIGCLWLIPYIQFAIIAFYMFVSGQKNEATVETEKEKFEEKTLDDNNGPISE